MWHYALYRYIAIALIMALLFLIYELSKEPQELIFEYFASRYDGWKLFF